MSVKNVLLHFSMKVTEKCLYSGYCNFKRNLGKLFTPTGDTEHLKKNESFVFLNFVCGTFTSKMSFLTSLHTKNYFIQLYY